MAYLTLHINSEAKSMGNSLRDKPYFRKHGANASYGQLKDKNEK
jgi:hypothetical protein